MRQPIVSMNERTITFSDSVEVVTVDHDGDSYVVSVILKSGNELTMGIAEDERVANDYFNYVVGCITSKEVR